jgi:uncharacterized protein YoaH (UPF0181 family)
VLTLAHELQSQDVRRGLVAAGARSGQAVALVLERA